MGGRHELAGADLYVVVVFSEHNVVVYWCTAELAHCVKECGGSGPGGVALLAILKPYHGVVSHDNAPRPGGGQNSLLFFLWTSGEVRPTW